MLKLFKSSLFFMAVAMTTLTLSSCGDDKDSDPVDNNTPGETSGGGQDQGSTSTGTNPTYVTWTGVDDDGHGGLDWDNAEKRDVCFFTYSGNTPTNYTAYIEYGRHGERGKATSNITGTKWEFTSANYTSTTGFKVVLDHVEYNMSGYITSFTSTVNSGTSTEKYNYQFEYNSDNRLTLIDKNCISDNSKSDETEIKWENGNLKSITPSLRYQEAWVFTTGSTVNSKKQVPIAMVYFCYDGEKYITEQLIRGLALAGKFGKGPEHMPNNMTFHLTYMGVARTEEAIDIDYTFNKNGNITKETFNVYNNDHSLAGAEIIDYAY